MMQSASAPQLIVKRGNGDYREIVWDRPIITVGRDAANDIIIDHPLASRRHARFEQTEEGFFVRDLDSTNGTFLNQERVIGTRGLHHADQILIADTVIIFNDPAATMKGVLDPTLLRAVRAEIRIDEPTKSVYIRGELLTPPLTVKEFQLLALLYRRQGEVVSKEEIANHVWDYAIFDYNAIDALVYRLRQRIEPDPSRPRYLITQRGFGYKLVVAPEVE
ncbi:winged helix-turn-helix domain-containing protein [Chloroflexus aggregans]|uniref:Two component transcriptional regulator, winged helix family n=2 Tax=Chloroflexus aggregans TaxID=152260 RepID=B8GC94_CHLAD|nr:winged helix-turn-helix domain-containing protein [Chloroflexus aggregans]ACL23068.1 putative two component transcriptional regulator, winged helix family [Chloroflexus aggregans DSM 9485]